LGDRSIGQERRIFLDRLVSFARPIDWFLTGRYRYVRVHALFGGQAYFRNVLCHHVHIFLVAKFEINHLTN
jgi:hypothetical protein